MHKDTKKMNLAELIDFGIRYQMKKPALWAACKNAANEDRDVTKSDFCKAHAVKKQIDTIGSADVIHFWGSR